LTVKVNAPLRAVTLVGESDVMVGTGLLMVKVAVPEVPPPGAGVLTETLAVPASAMSVEVMVAVRDVPEPYVVARLDPFHRTTELVSKFVPVTVSVKLALPATEFVGDIRVTVGTGFAMVNFRTFDAPPPGFGLKATTFAVPGVVTSEAGTDAVNCVALTKVVVSGVLFHRIRDAVTN